MVATGQWFYQDLKRYAPKLNYGVATFPIADSGGKVATTSGGFGYSIPKGAKHPNEAWKFIKFLTNKDSMLKMAKNAGMRAHTHVSLLRSVLPE